MRHVLAALVFAVTSAPALAESPVQQAFDAWIVTCDAAEYCVASTAGEGAANGSALFVARHAEETYWEVSILPGSAVEDTGAFTVGIDADEIAFAGAAEIARYGDAGHFYLLGNKAQQVLDRLVPGTSAEVRFPVRDGIGATAIFPLDGLAAALIFIDTRQGRLGSERVAEAAPIGLSPAGAEGLAGSLPADLLERRRHEPDCAPLEAVSAAPATVAAPIEAGRKSAMLYIVPCSSTGDRVSSAVYVGGDGTYARQAFAEFWPSIGWTGTMQVFGAAFDSASGTLSTAYKASALGDCGAAGLYAWTGVTFRLVEFRAKEACDGVNQEFPIVYGDAPPLSGQPKARPAQ